jgi:uncharacterized protein YbjQ (UPF0145 family)
MIRPDAVVTFEKPDGFRVVQVLGYVSGQATRPKSVLRTTFRSIGVFIGLATADYLTEAERARRDALTILLEKAEHLGANGIVAVQFQASEGGDGSTRVAAYGRAVVLDPDPGE